MDTVKQGGQQASRGFTLIEMSIVLVIIGLIIGGILKGQEIVNAAREKSLVNQVNAVRAAQNTYVDRHNALPGDDPNGTAVSAGVTTGNGDGLVGASAGAGPSNLSGSSVKTAMNAASGGSENVSYFVELVAEGLIGNAAPISAATTPANFGVANGSPLPSVSFGGSGLGIIQGSHTGNTNNAATATSAVNWLAVWSFINPTNGGVTPRAASHIDNEIDDGNPDTGLVRGDDAAAECNAQNASTYSSTAGLDKPSCGLLIQMVQ